jgi:hypothetical protein
MTPTEAVLVGVGFLALEVGAFALMARIFILPEVRDP